MCPENRYYSSFNCYINFILNHYFCRHFLIFISYFGMLVIDFVIALINNFFYSYILLLFLFNSPFILVIIIFNAFVKVLLINLNFLFILLFIIFDVFVDVLLTNFYFIFVPLFIIFNHLILILFEIKHLHNYHFGIINFGHLYINFITLIYIKYVYWFLQIY